MKRRLALMTSGGYPCVRVGKTTAAMSNVGWEHDSLSAKPPFQMERVYRNSYYDPQMTWEEYGERIANHDGELIHVHNEPNWPVVCAKEYTDKPVIFNVHDVTSVRPDSPFDPYEEDAFRLADGYVFITEEQRKACIDYGFGPHMGDKPYVILPNFASSQTFIDKTPLPHIGGIVYAGGVQSRGARGAWRDLSPIADACAEKEVPFHIYPGNPNVDYGIVHNTVLEYDHLIHAMARHDWGFTGPPEPVAQWAMSVPNKVFEYMAAGIPIIAINNPLIRPLCEAGMGVYVKDVKDIPKVYTSVDPKPFVKAVMANRDQFTFERNIGSLAELYEAVLDNA